MPGLPGCEGQSPDRSSRTRPAPFPRRVSSAPLIPVPPPPTHPPTHRRTFLFHVYHAASIMAVNSSSCIGTDPLADHNSHSNSTTPPTDTVSAPPADELNSTAGTSAERPASPNAPAHPRSKAYAQGTVTGAVGSTPAIAGVRTGHRHRRRRQSTRYRRRGHTAPSPAPSGVSTPSHCKLIRKECGRLPTHI